MMKDDKKYIQYFFDASQYRPEQVVDSIEKEKAEQFPKENVQIEIKLNDYGVYVATLIFEKNKNFSILNLTKKINVKNQKNNSKKLSKYEKLVSQSGHRVYGQYKQTKTYKPY